MIPSPNTRWWGWGNVDESYDLGRRPQFWPFIKKWVDVPEVPWLFPPEPQEISLPPIRLSAPDLDALSHCLPPKRIETSPGVRLRSTYGKSYYDLIRIRYRQFHQVPDAVLFPEREDEIQNLLRWANRERVAIVPRGGGTSVVGGVQAYCPEGYRALLVVDLRLMNKILRIIPESLLADVEAGIFGPALEEGLQAKGFTFSHYPESFRLSTLGGWIAARSAGQQSTRYGKIEDMVESLRIVLPEGIVETPRLPAAANGPDLDQLFIGSEGTLGIITRARIKIKPLPLEKYYSAFLFRNFEEGVNAIREIMQSGFRPATLRLSDGPETAFALSLLEKSKSPIFEGMRQLAFRWMQARGYLPDSRALMILGIEGGAGEVPFLKKRIQSSLKAHGAFNLGRKAGQSWYRNRFQNPYLRDILMDYGLLVDTLETATEWENLWALYHAVREAIQSAYQNLGIRGVVLAHLSHVYPQGSSLYFILLASPHPGKEIEEWHIIKRAASDAIVTHGGTISHHHGVGLDHRQWLRAELGDEAITVLRKIKSQLDPFRILNPGKLLPEEGERFDEQE